MTVAPIHAAAVTELDILTLYRLLELRVAVFVVEQACAYAELDGQPLSEDPLRVPLHDDGTSHRICAILG